MRQVVKIGIISWEGVILRVDVGHLIVTSGEFVA